MAKHIPPFADESAFPRSAVVHPGGETLYNEQWGLTRREVFASMALQGVLASNALGSPEQCADYAVKCADALLKRLQDNST